MVMAQHERAFNQKLQDLNQIKQQMQHTAHEYSLDVDSALTSVKNRIEQESQRQKDIESQSFVVGGHLIDQNLQKSITDPEIKTIKKQLKQDKTERKKQRKEKRRRRREARERTERTI